MSNTQKNHLKIRQMVMIALFVAMTYLANFICNFKVGFLSFEAKDAVTTVCAYAFGPVSGIIVAFLSAVIESLSASATGIYGFIMNVAGSVTYVGVAGIAYKMKKNITGAVIGVTLASILMTSVMIGLNLVLTPLYMGVDGKAVIDMVIPMLLPFNLVKGIFNSTILLIIRYPLLKAMQAAGVLNEPVNRDSDKIRNIVLAFSALFAIFAVMYFVVVLGGRVEIFE